MARIVDDLALIEYPKLPTIKACAITARAFLPRARHHLFRHIHLAFTSVYGSSSSRQGAGSAKNFFIHAIAANSTLAPLVKSITLAEALWDGTDEGRDPTTGSETRGEDDLEDLLLDDEYIERVLSSLVNLEAVKLKKVRIGFLDWYHHSEWEGTIPPDLTNTHDTFQMLAKLFNGKPILMVTLDRVRFKHRHLLTQFIRLFPHLTFLHAASTFKNEIFGAEKNHIASLEPDGTSLQSIKKLGLHFSNSEADVRACLNDPFPLDLSRLWELQIHGHSMHSQLEVADIEGFLHLTQSSLKSAVFYFRAFHPSG